MSLIQLVIERARGLLGGGRVREQTFTPPPDPCPQEIIIAAVA